MKKLVNLNNQYRVVLTEVLPYETPFLFSNLSFYENLQIDGTARWLKDNFYPTKDAPSQPFEYHIHRRGGKKSRALCVVHPYAQVKVSDFYQKYCDYLIYLSNLSPFSLRHISTERRSIFVDDPEKDKFQKYDSYFEYEDFNREYKFFESSRFLRLEQKYKYQRILDIEKCFYHIYTHTFAWAVKGKEAIKDSLHIQEKTCTCETEFDDLMMNLNYRETNGIVVGPEFSRIFAEIILQRVDLNVLSRLKSECDLIYGRHYEVKRYVDDYFIFFYSEDILNKIEAIVDEELVPYKLFLNESKKETLCRPFPNHITAAKADISSLFDRFYEKWKHGHTYMNQDREDFQSFANKIREVASTRQVGFESVVRYLLTLMSRSLDTILINNEEEGFNIDVLLNIVEISLYVYSLDMTPSSSYKICKIIQSAYDISKRDKEACIEVEQLLRLELKRILDIHINEYDVSDTNVEALNILLLIEREKIFDMDRDFIMRLFPHTANRKFDWHKMNYFHLCSLLYLFADKNTFAEERAALSKYILSLFVDSKEKNIAKSELILLLFDYSTCPFIDKSEKNKLISKAMGVESKRAGEIRRKIASYDTWFFDWTGKVSTREYLYRKEAHAPY